MTEFRSFPSVLRIYMSAQMYDAMTDLTSHGQPAPPDLYERFLAWIRRAHLIARQAGPAGPVHPPHTNGNADGFR